MTISIFGGLWEKVSKFFNERSWLRISLMLCVVGFLKEFRPSEPFVFEYMIGDWRNLTETQVSQEVIPVSIYSLLGMQFIVLLVTDICRYKIVMIVMGLIGCGTWSMLIWTTSLVELQLMCVSVYVVVN